MSLWSFQSVCWPPICICSTSIYLCKLLLIYVNVIFKWHSQAVKVIFFTKDTDVAAASWRAGKRLNPSAFYRYLTFPFSISWFACRRARVLHQTLIHDTGSLSSEQCRTWLPCGIKSSAMLKLKAMLFRNNDNQSFSCICSFKCLWLRWLCTEELVVLTLFAL